MDEHRRTAMLSSSTSATSMPTAMLHQDRLSSSDVEVYVKQLQIQLQAIRAENEEFAANALNLQNRIHQLEENKITVSSNFNKENAELQTLVARLQSQLERGEAVKQSLECDLTIVKKKLSDVTRSTTHKEVALAKQTIQLSDEKSSLELKLGETENELVAARQLTADNEKRIALLEDEKRQVKSDAMASEAILRAESEKLSGQVTSLRYDNEQLKLSIDDMKQRSATQESHLQKLVADLQASVEREQRVRHDMDELAQRARSLEECVEAERAAHLESKFNSEIIQLKHEEFQNERESEKKACEMLQHANEENVARLAELEKQLQFERHQSKNANDKLEKTIQAYADVRKQLDEEISVKNHVIEDTKSKLEEHQDQLNSVKDELAKARKRMLYLEENHGADIRELELLLESFCNVDEPGLKSKGSGKVSSEHSKLVLESLRKNLFAYQKRISELQIEIESYKFKEKEIAKDCDNFRDLALTREKSMQQTQRALAQCKDELETIQKQQSEFVREAEQAGHDLAEMSSGLQLQRERCQELEDNVNAIKDRHNNEIEIHVGYLRELHHVVCSATGEKNSLTRFAWSDLSVTIRESVDVLINNFQRAKDKINHLESSTQEMQQSITELQRAHASSVDRLADRCREREEEGARQRKQLEQHYEELLAEMNARTRKTQSLCDEAWERIRSKDGLHDGLQAECAQLRGENSNLQQERKALACACAILFGALYPVFRARDELAQQRSLLERIIADGEVWKRQMRSLVSTLNDELKPADEQSKRTSLPTSFRFIHPLIRFRVAVICVLACNRLNLMSKHANIPMFCCDESLVSNKKMLVVAGRTEQTSDVKAKEKVAVKSRSDAVVDWLMDGHVVHGVRDATCGLMDAVEKNAGDSSGYMSRAVVKTSKTAFLNLIDVTHRSFPSYVIHGSSSRRDRMSLCRLLTQGLDKLLNRCASKQVACLFSAEHSFAALQSHLIEFTERLHAAEVEKRNLRHNEAALKSKLDQLNAYRDQFEENDQEMKRMKEKEKELVSRARFDGVCSELTSALQREKRAQKLLREQNAKLQELSGKYEEQCNDGAEKEVTLSQAITSLTEVKMDLKRSMQSKRQLEKQVGKLQNDRERLQSLVHDAKSALKRAAGEKTSMTKYFEVVENALKSNSDEEAAEKLRLKSEELIDHNGPGMKAAKRAVDSFVRAQSSAVARINNLESQIASYRSHISSLKRELHNACHRENEHGAELEHMYDFPTKDPSHLSKGTAPHVMPKSYYSTPLGDGNEFRPLHGEVIEQPSIDQSNLTRNMLESPVGKPLQAGDFAKSF